jgi:hypothetical protein
MARLVDFVSAVRLAYLRIAASKATLRALAAIGERFCPGRRRRKHGRLESVLLGGLVYR